MVAIGKAKTGTMRGEQKTYLVPSRFKIYRANYLTKTNTNFAPLAMEEQSNEVYQYILINKLITRKIIAQDNSPEIQDLTLSKIMHRTGIAMTEDREAKSLRLIPMSILHLRMKVYVRRQAYRVICNARKNNWFQLPTATVFKSHDHIKGTLCGSDMFTGIDFTGYFDQIACDVITSMINSIQYLGKEYAPLTAPMGSTNAPLAATVTANTIVHHINDALVTQEMIEPRNLSNLRMGQATRTMTIRESWGNDAPIDMPGCKLLYKVIQKDIKGEKAQRRETEGHYHEKGGMK